MKSLFDKVSAATSKNATRTYSSSFSLGILFLSKEIRQPIYNIYGFVRFADEIVDSFHGYDKSYLLQKFRNDTFEAIEQKICLNPILNSFQATVNNYSINTELIDTFLKSMEMDLNKKNYTIDAYKEYILGSAEVVGLMCLRVFTNGNLEDYNTLKPYAMKLGAAFQKINFLRDIKDDYAILGRVYFPHINFEQFSEDEKKLIENDIEHDFKIALEGIKKLPKTSKAGVYLAYYYYYQLFKKIKNVKAQNILETRIRIPNIAKTYLMLESSLRLKLNRY
jgi:phytoene synthase